MSQPPGRYEYAVRYRRAGWKARQVRFYQSRPPADRLAHNLIDGYPNGADRRNPNDRRAVGRWEPT